MSGWIRSTPKHRDASYPIRRDDKKRAPRKPRHAEPWTETRIASDYAAKWEH